MRGSPLLVAAVLAALALAASAPPAHAGGSQRPSANRLTRGIRTGPIRKGAFLRLRGGRPRRALRPGRPERGVLRSALRLRSEPTARGRLLATPAASASARLDLIRTARHEINTSAYIFGDDRVARIALAELRTAARKGKKVRLLLDGAGNGLSSAALAHLLDEGIEVGIFNRLTARKLLRPLSLSNRMHDKLLITDGEQLVLGGRNVEEGYFGFSRPGYTHFDDVDTQVEGAAAASANDYFMDLWNGPHVERLRRSDLRVSAGKVARYRGAIDHAEKVSGRARFTSFQGSWREQPAAALERVEFVHGDPRQLGNPERNVYRRLIRLIDEAGSEVEIHTPYLVPDADLLGAIARARERGVTVRVVTNSRSTVRGAEHLAQWAYEAQVGALARAGAELWEVAGPRALHAKTVVVDRNRVFVGSYNMDLRSRDLQKEVGVIADSPELAGRLLEHGTTLRRGGLLAAQGGKVTALKKEQCGRGCRFFARFVFAPLAHATGLHGQL